MGLSSSHIRTQAFQVIWLFFPIFIEAWFTLRSISNLSLLSFFKVRELFSLFTPQALTLSVNYKAFSIMHYTMLRQAHNFKIFQPIIRFVSVLMVNNLIFKKLSTKMLFHNNSMFSCKLNSPCLLEDSYIAIVYRSCTIFSFHSIIIAYGGNYEKAIG